MVGVAFAPKEIYIYMMHTFDTIHPALHHITPRTIKAQDLNLMTISLTDHLRTFLPIEWFWIHTDQSPQTIIS